ncbi:MAG TPA: hypothetical protein VM846_18430 [Vicinamibacterales bacterium]|nr:hypothetical protein [Vicinamibacterales bacterium]
MTRYTTLLALCVLSFLAANVQAARLRLFIDGDLRTAYDASRGKAGRAEWTAAVNARKGTILTNDFQGVNIDVPADKETSIGHFSVFFSQTGGYSTQAGNTAPQKHPTGVFVGTTGTGSTAGKNDETIQGLELRFETLGPVTKTLELRFNPPIYAWAADVFSVDGKGFGQGNTPESNDHTTLRLLGHSFDFSQIFTYAGSGYNSFFGIVSDTPFSSISFTAGGDGDRWRLDNVSIAR